MHKQEVVQDEIVVGRHDWKMLLQRPRCRGKNNAKLRGLEL